MCSLDYLAKYCSRLAYPRRHIVCHWHPSARVVDDRYYHNYLSCTVCERIVGER